MSSENEGPKYNRGRRGSVDDTVKEFLNPKLQFQKEELPKGSNALQILIHQCENEIHKDGSGSDSDVDDDKIKKPTKAYMGRRRNTIACNYSHDAGVEGQFRKMSLAPILEGERGRNNLLNVPKGPRTRSLSPMQENVIRKNSMKHTHLGFGSTRTRETVIK